VSGLAVMLRERYPQMNQNDFAEILKMSSMDLGEPGYDTSYGYGLIQVPEAILAAAEYFGDEAPVPTETPDDSGSSWNIFDFSWIRDLFQNIIRNLFKGWNLNFSL
jgi:subtilase-type serine protease